MRKGAASHNKQNYTDSISVSFVENTLSTNGRVMPKIDKVDKWPNRDGSVDVHDAKNQFVGKLDVQVKTLKAGHKNKFPCSVTFLYYCESEPCLLLLVDNANKKIYWKYYNHQAVGKLNFKGNKRTKTLDLSGMGVISSDDKSYIDQWLQIIRERQQIEQNYPEIKKKLEELSGSVNTADGQEAPEFTHIHKFLDLLNSYLDHEFNIVKRTQYPDAWKLGFAYSSFTDEDVTYTLYPIPKNKNDNQIKHLTPKLAKELWDLGLGFNGHSSTNPILQKPDQVAKTVIESELSRIFEAKLLDCNDIEVLAREYVFAIVDKFNVQLGLDIKDEYTAKELEHAFRTYLPFWFRETHEFMKKTNRNGFNERVKTRRAYFYDPDLINELTTPERNAIATQVLKNIKDRKEVPVFPVVNIRFNLIFFYRSILYFDHKKITARRLYKPRDYSRLGGNGGWIWQTLSREDVDHNFRIIFDNLQGVYSEVLAKNFPLLEDKLHIYPNADRVVAFWTRLNVNQPSVAPIYEVFQLQSADGQVHDKIEVIGQQEALNLAGMFGKKVLFDGREYVVVGQRSSIMSFIYEDTPLLNLVVSTLRDNLENYLRKGPVDRTRQFSAEQFGDARS